MYLKEEINIEKMIVHILDTNLSIPVLSMDEMTHNYEIKDFFINHIVKVINDDSIKTCIFNEDHNMFYSYLQDFINDKCKFIDFTTNVSSQLFNIMSANIDIPSCDLAIIIFTCRNDKYISILKMNYLHTYIHYTDYDSDVNVNTIIKHKTTLPSPSQRINEAIIINLNTLDINILEKKYEIDGLKEFYLSKYFLKCGTKLSSKEQYNIVKKTTDSIAKKYFDEDIEKKMEIKQELYNNIEESGEIDLNKFANEVFDSNISLKDEFIETLEKKGLEEPLVQLTEKTITRSFDKQKIKTDSGIEIKIPIEIYNDPNNVEFITNPDGKISIVIKNINKIL
jgi:hypothetical protein